MNPKPILNYGLSISIALALPGLCEEDKPVRATPAVKAAPERKPHVEVLEQARQAQKSGDTKVALPKYKEAIQSAEKAGDKERQATARIEKGRLLETRGGGRDHTAQQEAAEDYREAIKVGSPAQQSVAKNNLGALLLKEDKSAEALKTLKDVDSKLLSPNQRVTWQHNLGRAYEAQGQRHAALAEYKQVIAQNPSYEKPIESAFSLLNSSETGIREAAELAMNLLERGQTEVVARHLRESLLHHSRDSDVEELLVPLVRYYAAIGLTPAGFREQEEPFLSKLANGSTRLSAPIAEVQLAFAGRVVPTFSPSDAGRAFPFWSRSPDRRKALSLLLKRIGDYYSQGDSGQSGQGSARAIQSALGCYSTAWTLNTENIEAALYTAAVLRDHARALDPAGSLMRQYIDRLFSSKGSSYSVQLKTLEDWENILRCHLVLGTIFENRKQWGPADEPDPKNVIFQLSLALNAEKQLQTMRKETPPSPGLYMRLARAYAQTGDKSQAWNFYVQAAEGFLHFSRRPSAQEALGEAAKLSLSLDATRQQRLQRIEADIRRDPA